MKLWACLVVFRLLWAIAPQSGYIHPDEFFQTVEVVAGDTFNISIERTWEFNQSFPLRSVVLPQMIFSPVFSLLSYLDESTSFILSAYHVIVSYRLVMAVLSISVDLNILKVCRIYNLPGQTAAVLVASSYVTLTFLTHSFSNSLEALLFSALFSLIVECKESDKKFKSCVQSKTTVDINDKDNDKCDEVFDLDTSFNNLHKMAFMLRKRSTSQSCADSETSADNDKTDNVSSEGGKKNLPDIDKQCNTKTNSNKPLPGLYMNVMLITVTLVVGIFNRPTFVIFSFLPCLWWLFEFYGEIGVLFKRGFVLILASITISFLFICIDTMYYNNIPLTYLLSGQTDIWNTMLNHHVITPVNFIIYNSISTNLASHGLHPCYTHLAVNMPMLFAPLLFCLGKYFTFRFILPLSHSSQTTDKHKTTDQCKYQHDNIGSVFLSFTYFPVICLSIFPHQEARFLIPLLPLVALSVVLLCNKLGKFFWFIFIIFNIFLSIVFGVLHQGGVVPCLLHLHNIHHSSHNENQTIHIVLSHTYMPPKHLLMSQSNNFKLYDMQGSDLNVVNQKLIDLISVDPKQVDFHSNEHCDSDSSNQVVTGHFVTDSDCTRSIYLVIPGSLLSDSMKHLSASGISYSKQLNFFPHVSFEDPPNFLSSDNFDSWYDQFSLILVEVS